MGATVPSNRPEPQRKPPEVTSGARRPATVTSSPNGKNEKETMQPKKKAMALNLDHENVELETDFSSEMEAESPIPIGEKDTRKNKMDGAWEGEKPKLFSEVLMEEGWYVVESDSEDVAEREKEEDEVLDEENFDPPAPNLVHGSPKDSLEKRVAVGSGRKGPRQKSSLRPPGSKTEFVMGATW
ncbi:unnamed protein product [Linum trigynum]|uniref:Uncharacterized protein n=1 Tax=Linum trigynum TaxID=586398 RepID=A0AAV2C896_9ROSI